MNRIDQCFLGKAQAGEPVLVRRVAVDETVTAKLLAEKIRQEEGIWELEGIVGARPITELVRTLRQDWQLDVPIVVKLHVQQVFCYGWEAFTDACIRAGVDGVRIMDLPMEEQPQLKVYLLKEGAPYLLQEICPQSGDRIPNVTELAKGFVYCTADPVLWAAQTEFGSPLMFFLYAAEAVCPVPLVLDFPQMAQEALKPYLSVAKGAVISL